MKPTTSRRKFHRTLRSTPAFSASLRFCSSARVTCPLRASVSLVVPINSSDRNRTRYGHLFGHFLNPQTKLFLEPNLMFQTFPLSDFQFFLRAEIQTPDTNPQPLVAGNLSQTYPKTRKTLTRFVTGSKRRNQYSSNKTSFLPPNLSVKPREKETLTR
jgi:hypothetical protein